jgi:uncharacterized cupin superfamily protein
LKVEHGETGSEARLDSSEHGLAPSGEGWFVLNAHDAVWQDQAGRGVTCEFEGDPRFSQIGINLTVLAPGEPMTMYHWEANQEDFLVLRGQALLIVEGEERPLRQWDFVHCPAGTNHAIVGAGVAPCVVLAVGARERSAETWGGYTVADAAVRHGAGVQQATSDPRTAYARFTAAVPTRYREDWLPR